MRFEVGLQEMGNGGFWRGETLVRRNGAKWKNLLGFVRNGFSPDTGQRVKLL